MHKLPDPICGCFRRCFRRYTFCQACRGPDVPATFSFRAVKSTGEVTDAQVSQPSTSLSRQVDMQSVDRSLKSSTLKGLPQKEFTPKPNHEDDLAGFPYRVPIYKDFLLAYATSPGERG